MVNYKCPRCGYETHIKTIYVRHLERKIICKPKKGDIDLIEEYKIYGVKYTKSKSEKKPKLNPNEPCGEPKMNQNEPKKTKNEPKCEKSYECKFCKKKYSTNSHLYRHLKTCKEKKKKKEDKKNL